MHGLINRALQSFVEVTYGPRIWAEVVSQADLEFDEFQSMLMYPDDLTVRCFEAATNILHRPPSVFLEDLGTFVVTHEPFNPLRRLLRFGGEDFAEFLHSLEELGDRGRLVMPDLDMPDIRVHQEDGQTYEVRARWKMLGAGPMLLGALRAMADEYGALALCSLAGVNEGWESLKVTLHLDDHSEGRAFSLGGVSA